MKVSGVSLDIGKCGRGEVLDRCFMAMRVEWIRGQVDMIETILVLKLRQSIVEADEGEDCGLLVEDEINVHCRM